jgi:hypothetical protein
MSASVQRGKRPANYLPVRRATPSGSVSADRGPGVRAARRAMIGVELQRKRIWPTHRKGTFLPR